MNQNELAEILTDHKLWLNTEGREGERADFRGANLKFANLKGTNLREADLRRADLREADLEGADLSRADLKGADLSGVNLRNADLRNADLWRADLREADLIGANLTNAWLGKDDWKGIPIVLGNVLVTECYKRIYSNYWQIKTWSAIKESNQEFYEVLYL